jgi:hypothetical protein
MDDGELELMIASGRLALLACSRRTHGFVQERVVHLEMEGRSLHVGVGHS